MSSQECVLVVIIALAEGQFVRKPQNTVVFEGGRTVLNCTSDVVNQKPNTHYQVWGKFRSGYRDNMAMTISVNDYLVDVESIKSLHSIRGRYDLVFKKAALANAGEHTCYDDGNKDSKIIVHVLVLRSPNTLTSNVKEDGIVVEGDTVTFSCNIRYIGDWEPNIEWTDSDNNIIKSRDTIKQRTQHFSTGFYQDYVKIYNKTSEISFTASREKHHLQQYSCTVYFTMKKFGGDMDKYHATNVPAYRDTQRSPVLKVQGTTPTATTETTETTIEWQTTKTTVDWRTTKTTVDWRTTKTTVDWRTTKTTVDWRTTKTTVDWQTTRRTRRTRKTTVTTTIEDGEESGTVHTGLIVAAIIAITLFLIVTVGVFIIRKKHPDNITHIARKLQRGVTDPDIHIDTTHVV